MQAVVVKLYKLLKQNLGFRLYRRALISENKFRAARHGLSGKLIDFGKQEEVSTINLVYELLEFVDDVVKDRTTDMGHFQIVHVPYDGTLFTVDHLHFVYNYVYYFHNVFYDKVVYIIYMYNYTRLF